MKNRMIIHGFLSLAVTALLIPSAALANQKIERFLKSWSEAVEIILPGRGKIFDRNGKLLAGTSTKYKITLVPANYGCHDPDKVMTCYKPLLLKLRKVLRMDTTQWRLLVKRLEKEARQRMSGGFYRENLKALLRTANASDRARFQSYLKRRFLPVLHLKQEYAASIIQKLRNHPALLKGIRLVPVYERHYPHAKEFSHVLGYVRYPRPPLTRSKRKYRNITRAGFRGLESQYKNLLRGKPGRLLRKHNLKDEQVYRVVQAAEHGKDIHLALDLRMQKLAYRLLGRHAGSVVAIDPGSGEVLTLVSTPGYNTNLLVKGVSPLVYREWLTHPQRPMRNRAVSSAVPPGSLVKPLLALAGMHHGLYPPRKQIQCNGFFRLPGVKHRWRDWKRSGHGTVNISTAVSQSCDVFFYGLAVRLGIDRISSMLERFNWGRVTGIDLPGEAAGMKPARSLKKRLYAKRRRVSAQQLKWYTGDTINVGIGQGLITVTPVQLAYMTAIIANRGTGYRPALLRHTGKPGSKLSVRRKRELQTRIKDVSPLQWEVLIKAMTDVVHKKSGTARHAGKYIRGTYRVAAKTGVAHVITFGKPGGRPDHLRNHSLFIAFAPASRPKIAIAVVVEHGYGLKTGDSATIGIRLIDAWLNGNTNP